MRRIAERSARLNSEFLRQKQAAVRREASSRISVNGCGFACRDY